MSEKIVQFNVIALNIPNTQGNIFETAIFERINRAIRCRTRVVGAFLGGSPAPVLVYAHQCHVADTQWGNKKLMSIKATGGCKPFANSSCVAGTN